LKKLIYVEENFISPDECQRFIDLSLANKGKEMLMVMKPEVVILI